MPMRALSTSWTDDHSKWVCVAVTHGYQEHDSTKQSDSPIFRVVYLTTQCCCNSQILSSFMQWLVELMYAIGGSEPSWKVVRHGKSRGCGGSNSRPNTWPSPAPPLQQLRTSYFWCSQLTISNNFCIGLLERSSSHCCTRCNQSRKIANRTIFD